MPGWNNADNKFGLTPFIVGQVLGDGCNYDTIQTAIDECFAAGGGVVGIRASTANYVENLTLRAGVELYGFCVDGRLPAAISSLVIEGNHTFTQAGGFGIVIAQYITFSAVAGDAFTMIATGGASALFAFKFGGIQAQTVAGQRAILMNPDAGASCQFSTDNINIQADFHCFENIGLGSANAFLQLGSINSSTGDIFNVSGGGNVSVVGLNTELSANGSILNSVLGVGGCDFTYTELATNSEAVLFGVGGGSCSAEHCSFSCGAISGNWIDGPAGTLSFGDVLLTGSAQNIGAAIAQTKDNWQPYGETAAGALGSNRGTASFDSAQFTVTDGWVQISGGAPAGSFPTDAGTAVPVAGVLNILGGPGVTTTATGNTIEINSVIWSNAIGPVLVIPDSGTFDVVGTTITLPAAPVQGEECRIVSSTSPTVVEASGVQTIQVGTAISAAGGTATSTAVGNSLVLVYMLALDRWYSVATNGNWLVV